MHPHLCMAPMEAKAAARHDEPAIADRCRSGRHEGQARRTIVPFQGVEVSAVKILCELCQAAVQTLSTTATAVYDSVKELKLGLPFPHIYGAISHLI